MAPSGGDPGRDGLDQARRDPFGRLDPNSGNGGLDDGGFMRIGKAPNDYALDKAKEILEELRQRAGERIRPEIERDYIDRLLEAVLTPARAAQAHAASVSATAAQISASVNGLAMMRWASASRLWARWRSLA